MAKTKMPVSGQTLLHREFEDLWLGFRRLDFTSASDHELEQLMKCCDAATFGRNNEDAFDESYPTFPQA